MRIVNDVLAYNHTHRSVQIPIINEMWILDSIAQASLLDDSSYRYEDNPGSSPVAGSKRERDSSEEKV